MFRPRIIPVLLLKNQGLVKSVSFKNHQYIGDPINSVKIFNDLKADELAFLDILATKENRTVSLDFVKNVGEEANMPFAVGGGIKTIEHIRGILEAGAEKVIIGAEAALNPSFIEQSAAHFGSSTIVVCIDIKKTLFGRDFVWIKNGAEKTPYKPVEFAKLMEERGAGEIIVQSIERDGTMKGYDIETIRIIAKAVNIPVVALGGAGNYHHLREASHDGHANALAAGSIFVYHGPRKGILITYPGKNEIKELLNR